MKQRKPFYRVREIAAKSKIPASTLYDAVRSGQIEALRLGAAIFVPEREARRLLGEVVTDEKGGDEAA